MIRIPMNTSVVCGVSDFKYSIVGGLFENRRRPECSLFAPRGQEFPL